MSRDFSNLSIPISSEELSLRVQKCIEEHEEKLKKDPEAAARRQEQFEKEREEHLIRQAKFKEEQE